MAAHIQTQDYFRELVTMLFIRKRIIIVVTTLVTLGAICIAVLWPPVYEAIGKIRVKQNQPLIARTSVEEIQPEMVGLREEDINSEIDMIQSRQVAELTVAALYEKEIFRPEVLPKEVIGADAVEMSRKRARVQLINRIYSNIEASREPNSYNIRVRLTWDNPSEAEQVLDEYFRQYFIYRARIFNPPDALHFFEQQFQRYYRELAELEDELVRVSRKHNVSNAAGQINSNLMTQQDLEQRIAALQGRHSELVEQIRFLEQARDSDDLEFFTSVDVINLGRLAEKLMNLVLEREALLRIYTEESQQVRSKDREVKGTRAQLDRELSSYVEGQQAKLAGINQSLTSLRAELAKIGERNLELRTNQVYINRLQRDISMMEDNVKTFGKRLEETRINANAHTDTMFSVSTTEDPFAVPTAVFPNRPKVVLVGIVLGFVLACMIGFIVEFFDHTFKRPEDVTNYTSLDPVFSIRAL